VAASDDATQFRNSSFSSPMPMTGKPIKMLAKKV
jgi:hypothetical protein